MRSVLTIHYTYIHTPKVYQVQVSTEPLLLAHIIHQIAVQANLTSDILGQTCFSSFYFFFVSHKDFFWKGARGVSCVCEEGKQSVGCLGQWFLDSSSSLCCFSSTEDNGTWGFSGSSLTHTYTHRKKKQKTCQIGNFTQQASGCCSPWKSWGSSMTQQTFSSL